MTRLPVHGRRLRLAVSTTWLLVGSCLCFWPGLALAESPNPLYSSVGMTKEEVVKAFAYLEFVRDWGPGNSLDLSEGSWTHKFLFGDADVCVGVMSLGFTQEIERFDAELHAISNDGWRLENTWADGSLRRYVFVGSDGEFRAMGNTQTFTLGIPGAHGNLAKSGPSPDPEAVAAEEARIRSLEVARPEIVPPERDLMATVKRSSEDSVTLVGEDLPFELGQELELHMQFSAETARAAISMWTVVGRGTVGATRRGEIEIALESRLTVEINGESHCPIDEGEAVRLVAVE